MTLISKITAGVAVAGVLALGFFYFNAGKGKPVQTSQPIPASFSINSTGALNWSMDIVVPPGIQNIQPQLSINYTSQNVSGLLGVGFDLEGLSSITRTGATLAQDGFNGGVAYNAADRFQLNGNRLMLMSGGAYGAANTVYHTQNESWTKVVAVGQSGSGPQSFQIWTKKGIYFEYGNTNDSRVAALSASSAATFAAGSARQWLVNKCRDLHGNTLTVGYTQTPLDSAGAAISICSGQGQTYPLRIDYTANDTVEALRSVQFVYELRPDSTTCFVGGSKFSTMARMSAIRTYVKDKKGDSTLVREVRIRYAADTPLNASLIASISVQGGDAAYAPTSFNWSEGQDTLISKVVSWNGNETNVGFVGDFNGDGRNDILQSNTHVYLGASSGFEDAGNSGIFYSSSEYNFVGDFNGDGLSDFLETSTGGGTIYYFNPETNVFSSSKPVSGLNISSGCYPSKCVWQGDFNGDGMSDICSAIEETVYVNFGNATTGLNPYLSQTGLQVYAGNTYAADFNGDGMTDIFSCNQNTGYLTLSNWSQSTTDGFLPSISIPGMNFTISSTEAYTWVGDYNGDGLADILAKGSDQNYRLYYATGAGFQSGKIIDINLATTAVWPADFNHDGEMDFYAASSNNGIIYLSDGMDFSKQEPVNYPFETQYTWLGDFNGDGLTDLFNAFYKEVYYGGNAAAGNQSINQQGNLITAISNGTGSVVSLTYKPITDTTVYTPGASTATVALEGQRALNRYNTFPLSPVQNQLNGTISIQTAMFVVSDYTITDGRGSTYAYQQQYAGAKYDMTGYGFLGYQQINAIDLNRTSLQKTFYLQEYPFTGMTDSTVTLDMAGNLYNSTAYVWNSTAIPSATKVPTSQVLQQLKNTYQYYQQKISCQGQQQNWYDYYGNVQKSATTGNLAAPTTLWMFSAYDNDTSNWQLGYVTAAKQSSDSAGKQWLSAVRVSYNAQRNIDSVYTWFSSNNSWLSRSFGYDVYGNQLVQTSYSGDTTRIEYDNIYHSYPVCNYSPRSAQGLILQAKSVYEPFYGNEIQATDPNGNAFAYTYDGLGRLRQAWIPDSTGKLVLGIANNYLPADTGYVLQQIGRHDWAGNLIDTSYLFYDGMSRAYQSKFLGWDNKTVLWQQTSNAQGQVVAATAPYFAGDQPVWSHAAFDPIGRRIQSVIPFENADSIVTRIQYAGLTTMITRAAGTPDSTVSSYTYNYYNNSPKIVKFVNASGIASTYAWDLLGRFNNATDAGGNKTASAWNSINLNDWTYSTSSDTTFYYYQALQQTEFSVNALHDTIYSTYDDLGRLISSKAQRSQPITYQYDLASTKNGLGNLCLVTQDNGATSYSYTYDALDNVIGEQTQLDGRTWQQTSAYNPDLSKSSTRFPNGMQAQWAYNRSGQPVSVNQLMDGQAAKLVTQVNNVDATGAWLEYTFGNGVKTQKAFYTDATLQNMQVSGAGSSIFWSKSYAWTKHGLISAINDATDASENESYAYSPTGRLVQVQTARGLDSLAYSNVGNLVWNDSIAFSYTGYQVKSGVRASKTVYAAQYNAAGQQYSRTIEENGKSIAYSYKYNGYGQMDSVFRNDSLVLVYTYDYDGTRNRVINLLKGSTHYQVFDSYSEFVAGQSASASCSFNMGGVVLASFSSADSVEYYSCNQNSSTVLVTGGNGNVLKRFSYSPYGKFKTTGSDSTYAQYKYNGKEFDAESGLYYFNYRYYDPFSCRFNSPDNQLGGSLTTPDALNNYAFVNNSPITLSDPTGHQPVGAKAAEKTLELLALVGVETAADIGTDGGALPFEEALDELIIVDVSKKEAIDLTASSVSSTVSESVETQTVEPSGSRKRKRTSSLSGDGDAMEPVDKKTKYWDGDDSDSDDEDVDDPDDGDFKMKESRPSMSAADERAVFNSGRGADGKVRCARCSKELTGAKTYRRGRRYVRDWQKGHRTRYEYVHLKRLRDESKISEYTFTRAAKDPKYYRPECPPCNLSHYHESRSTKYLPSKLRKRYGLILFEPYSRPWMLRRPEELRLNYQRCQGCCYL